MNRLTIIGNLTKDPEKRKVNTIDGAVDVCDFTVAVNGRKNEPAQYFRCTAWRGLAELISKYASKGKKVAVIGPVSARAYTNKEGKEVAQIEVSVQEFEFCTPRSDADDTGLTYAPPKDDGFVKVDSEDMPF